MPPSPAFLFPFCLYSKSPGRVWQGGGSPAAPQLEASPTASRTAWEEQDESPFFVRAGSNAFPSLAAWISSYQMGPVPAPGAVVVQALQSLCWGWSQAAGFFLNLFSAGEQLCPEVCAYSARLAPCPLQSPQVFCALPTPPVLVVVPPAQPRAVWCSPAEPRSAAGSVKYCRGGCAPQNAIVWWKGSGSLCPVPVGPALVSCASASWGTWGTMGEQL